MLFCASVFTFAQTGLLVSLLWRRGHWCVIDSVYSIAVFITALAQQSCNREGESCSESEISHCLLFGVTLIFAPVIINSVSIAIASHCHCHCHCQPLPLPADTLGQLTIVHCSCSRERQLWVWELLLWWQLLSLVSMIHSCHQRCHHHQHSYCEQTHLVSWWLCTSS